MQERPLHPVRSQPGPLPMFPAARPEPRERDEQPEAALQKRVKELEAQVAELRQAAAPPVRQGPVEAEVVAPRRRMWKLALAILFAVLALYAAIINLNNFVDPAFIDPAALIVLAVLVSLSALMFRSYYR